jgi:hypothetical protein
MLLSLMVSLIIFANVNDPLLGMMNDIFDSKERKNNSETTLWLAFHKTSLSKDALSQKWSRNFSSDFYLLRLP